MADLVRHHDHHDPAVGEIPVPHGPATGGEHDHFPAGVPRSPPATGTIAPAAAVQGEDRAVFAYLTHPDDCYTPEGVYWADLPFKQRISFVNKVQNEEAKKELRAIGAMMKADPLSPVSWYFRNAVLPGAGLGLEGYVLFSIGNLEPLFRAAWPTCWGKHPTECSSNWIAAVTYLEVIGIMVGQMAVGVIGDWIGRRWGLIQDAAIMFVGLLMITASWGLTLNGWVICYAWSLFFYGKPAFCFFHLRAHCADWSPLQALASAESTPSRLLRPWKTQSRLANCRPARTACTVAARSLWPSSCRAGASSSTRPCSSSCC